MLLIMCGGVLSLVLARQFKLMKIVVVVTLSAGCFLGLIDAGKKLIQTGTYSASFEYLNIFALVFQIDALSAFFLFAIFLISLLTRS